jgi:hypothetical protein
MGTATTKAHKRVDIRRNDNVKVMTGKDRGKEHRVLRVLPDEGKVLVEHVMMVKKHVRPNRRAGAGDSFVECGSGMRDLRAGAHRTRISRRSLGASVQEVRDDAG